MLDSGSDVTLLRQAYFEKHLLPKIQEVTGEKAEAHQLFHLMVTNNGQLPVKMYTELDINFLGFKVPNVGVQIVDDLTQVLDKKHQTKLPGIVGWNLIWLSYNAFVEQYGASGFDSFVCLEGVNPLLFSQLCAFHYSSTENNKKLEVSSNPVSQQTKQISSPKSDDLYNKKINKILTMSHQAGHDRIKKEPYLHPREFVHHSARAYYQSPSQGSVPGGAGRTSQPAPGDSSK